MTLDREDTMTTTDVDAPDRDSAHYPADVAPKTRRRNAPLTPDEEASIERVRAAVRAVTEAERALDRARAARIDVLREEWVAHLSDLGPTRVAREIGEDLIGEGTVRGDTKDLRARERVDE